MSYPKPQVIISLEEYHALIDDAILLGCLEDEGVDEWEGYDNAQAEYAKSFVERAERQK